ncbi:hypothetical protein FIBSPDRAFT_871896 [Athelia psychrophila]|uniref:Uncharacterized protein n=1 Tax=Athelia psychrophila TaxID=1759441 RepID=A0A166A0V4_9AGAM|nr:hypothetical protein FIBSPDRAFT_871896 [Fibularhizoctonia sp. CBS 109695]
MHQLSAWNAPLPRYDPRLQGTHGDSGVTGRQLHIACNCLEIQPRASAPTKLQSISVRRPRQIFAFPNPLYTNIYIPLPIFGTFTIFFCLGSPRPSKLGTVPYSPAERSLGREGAIRKYIAPRAPARW